MPWGALVRAPMGRRGTAAEPRCVMGGSLCSSSARRIERGGDCLRLLGRGSACRSGVDTGTPTLGTLVLAGVASCCCRRPPRAKPRESPGACLDLEEG